MRVAKEKDTIFRGLDYYPFGMEKPGRCFSSGEYKYGYQNQEKDDEMKGEGNSYVYKYRIHDPRLGRFLSIDPLTASYPHNSPYAFAENRVIDGIELEGLEWQPTDDKGNNVATNANNISDYKWSGYETAGYEYNNTVYKNRDDVPNQGPYAIKPVMMAPSGTVAKAVIHHGSENMFTTYSVQGNLPLKETRWPAPWVEEAYTWYHNSPQAEIPGKKHNPLILGWHNQTQYPPTTDDDSGPWCSSFVNACINGTIYNGGLMKGTNSAWSQSWLSWGKSVSDPVYGAIAIFNWGGGKGHVGMVIGITSDSKQIAVLGGNQGDKVGINWFNTSSARFRVPTGYSIPWYTKKPYLPIMSNPSSSSENKTN